MNLNDPRFFVATHNIMKHDLVGKEIKRLILAQERLFSALLEYNKREEDRLENWWEVERMPLSLQKTLTDNFFRLFYFMSHGDLNHTMAQFSLITIDGQVIPVSEDERQEKRAHLIKWSLGDYFKHNGYLTTNMLVNYSMFLHNAGSMLIHKISEQIQLVRNHSPNTINQPQFQDQPIV